MKFTLLIVSLFFFINASAQEQKNIYDFKIKALDGSTIDLTAYKGKKMLIVNTASMCGYTPQYKALEELYIKYKDRLVVIGFPSDNFGGQEYADDTEIKTFCDKNYGVTFPLTTRVNVTGENVTPIYQYLSNKSLNGVLDATIKWNFNKFLVDEKGKVVAFYTSKVLPDGPEIINWVEGK